MLPQDPQPRREPETEGQIAGTEAVGSPRQGLRIRRRFTREGVHPFDEIEWELRDAVISNERGEVAFEQRNVEVPKFWSQLATNVVAQKYFRGLLGTPEREHSTGGLTRCEVRQDRGDVGASVEGRSPRQDHLGEPAGLDLADRLRDEGRVGGVTVGVEGSHELPPRGGGR